MKDPGAAADAGRPRGDAPWWQGAVGYEVYLRSFADSDGDGVGDLPGVVERLDHLADLGADVVWITPFYPSPQADHGYDVADYCDVDPRFGDLDDVDRLVERAHDLGLRLLIDLVPNHTSSAHPWFRSALQGRDAPHRDYYVWADPGPDGGPPNNWVSHFGGPAWTLHEPTGQYYLHLFLPEQPDLNWTNPAVADEFDDILRFWFERGVDGFRIDVAHSLLHDPALRDNPLVGEEVPDDPDPRVRFAGYEHLHDLDQPAVTGIYERWNDVAASYDALLLGEVYLLESEKLTRYVTGGTGLHRAFCFPVLHVAWDPDDIRGVLTTAVAAGEAALAWPLSSHDDPHAAERFGGGARGARRALAYLTLLCGLPGMPFLYQGDEIGLDDPEIARHRAADPVALHNRGAAGRDSCRTPMPWEPGDGYGFTTGEPWLPFGDRSDEDTVAVQRRTEGSHLLRVRRLLATRRGLPDVVGDEPVRWLRENGPVVALARGEVVVACNVGDARATLALPPGDHGIAFASADGVVADGGTVSLPPDTAAIVTGVRG